MSSSSFENQTYHHESFLSAIESLPSSTQLEFIECVFSKVDLNEMGLGRMRFIDCEFNNCNLSNVLVKSALFRNVKFVNSKLIGINWCEVGTLASASFEDCQMSYSVFQGMALKSFLFSGSRLEEVDFEGSDLTKANFVGALLRGANFNRAKLVEADFRQATEYYINAKETNLKKAKFSLPEALSLLSAFEISIES